jgi:DNA-binding response OmpR family regulator
VHAEILFVDEVSVTASFAPALRSRYTVAVTSTVATAKEYLRRARPALVILEMDVTGAMTADICREAKSYDPPAAVLVTTAVVEKVPAALAAGCDGVLLRPFPPNLFYGRIGRLLRAHRSTRERGTNREWPDVHCPHCHQKGVTSFEYASHRLAWYACLHCSHVWVAKEQDVTACSVPSLLRPMEQSHGDGLPQNMSLDRG